MVISEYFLDTFESIILDIAVPVGMTKRQRNSDTDKARGHAHENLLQNKCLLLR
jgi:hypothetical protein